MLRLARETQGRPPAYIWGCWDAKSKWFGSMIFISDRLQTRTSCTKKNSTDFSRKNVFWDWNARSFFLHGTNHPVQGTPLHFFLPSFFPCARETQTYFIFSTSYKFLETPRTLFLRLGHSKGFQRIHRSFKLGGRNEIEISEFVVQRTRRSFF